MRRLLILALLPLLAQAGEDPLTVFVCAGQSNMVGMRSVAADLPPELAGAQPSLFYDGTAWVPLQAGVTEKKGFGPELAFAHAMSKALGKPVGIIKYSKGGTNLAKQWHPEQQANLYADLTALVAKARATRPLTIAGMLWMQGETDSKDEAMAKAYAVNLTALIAAARKDFANPDMTFVCGRINPPEPYAHRALVRAAQQGCQAARYGWIDCDDLKLGPDNLHYTTAGLVEMGRRMAQRSRELLATRTTPRR